MKKTSPVPKKTAPKLLTFPQALNQLIDEKKITRVEWNDPQEYGILHDKFLCIHTKGKLHSWLVSESDLLAIDWMVV